MSTAHVQQLANDISSSRALFMLNTVPVCHGMFVPDQLLFHLQFRQENSKVTQPKDNVQLQKEGATRSVEFSKLTWQWNSKASALYRSENLLQATVKFCI